MVRKSLFFIYMYPPPKICDFGGGTLFIIRIYLVDTFVQLNYTNFMNKCYTYLHEIKKRPPAPNIFSYVSADKYKDKKIIIPFRCGYCNNCKSINRSAWLVRLTFESYINKPTLHLMLWLHDWNNRNVDLDYNLIKSFIKRLRKYQKEPFRYFCALEYGKNGKPHYHIILFNFHANDLKKIEHRANGHHIFHSDRIHKAWREILKIQIIDTGDMNALFTYLVSYTLKKKHFAKMKKEHNKKLNDLCTDKLYIQLTNDLRNIYLTEDDKKIILEKRKNTDFYKLKKSLNQKFNIIKERIVTSKSLGYQYFYENAYKLLSDGYVYINGQKMGFPIYWVRKLINEKCTTDEIRALAIDYYQNIDIFDINDFDSNKMFLRENSFIKKQIDNLINSNYNDNKI